MQPLSVIQKAALTQVSRLALPRSAKILDAPCGAGALTVAVAEAGFDAWGADLATDARAALGDHFVYADLSRTLPWPSSSFDAIVSTEGIEHLENRFEFLREAHRVLKPEGRLLLTTPNIASLRSRVRFLFSSFYHKDPRPLNESRRQPLHHIGLATFSDLRYALHTSGFAIAHVTATHVKTVSYAYGVLAPFIHLYTRLAFRKEKDFAQRVRNRDIRRTLVSPPLLFGENLLIVASKQAIVPDS
jgi:SAM-dependent methyltransferase